MPTLDNKVAFITGGSKGIGFGIAEALVARNMKVAVTSRSQQAADAAATALNKLGKGQAIGIAADVRDAAAQQKAADSILEKWGAIDVLVANAGVGYFG